MILRQTKALFVDAYRELNAKRLFWISLVISGLLVVAFALLGVRDGHFTILGYNTAIPTDAFDMIGVSLGDIYLIMFQNLGVQFWLAWGATILGLITTAGLIPDFISSGSIDLALSKPIGRVRLYLTKFATGLTFMTLQVSVFTVASFLVIGWRGGEWAPAIFLAIPLVVLFFSYLYSVCALIGLLTRSTIASLLLTILIWFAIFLVNTTDGAIVLFNEQTKISVERYEATLDRLDQRIANARGEGGEGVLAQAREASRLQTLQKAREDLADDLEEARSDHQSLERWAGRIYVAKTLLPKTNETIELLRRGLERFGDMPDLSQLSDGDNGFTRRRTYGEGEDAVVVETEVADGETAQRTQDVFDSRSVAWVLGSSLAFEAAMLALGCFVFVRRDF